MLRLQWLLLFLTVLFIFSGFHTKSIEELPPQNNIQDPISVERLAKELIRTRIVHWEVVLAQGIIEAGWKFESPLFRLTNNFIGMRVPGSRQSTRTGVFNGYSSYATWQDCVKDIKLWQDRFWKGGTRGEYIALMNRIWAESADYNMALRLITRKIDKKIAHYLENNKAHFNYIILMLYLDYDNLGHSE